MNEPPEGHDRPPRRGCLSVLLRRLSSPESDPIHRDQIRLLYDQASFGLFANIVNGLLLTLALSPVTSLPARVGWLGCLTLVTLGRWGLVTRYRSASPDQQADPAWGRRFVWGAAAAGATWGSAVLVLFPAASVPHQLFLLFIFAGMVSGAVISLPPLREAFLSFSGLILLPLLVRVSFDGGSLSPYIALAILMFWAFMVVTSCKQHRTITDSLRLRHENRQLVSSLFAEKQQQEQLNADLKHEVTERQAAQDALRRANEGLEQRVAERTAELRGAVRLLEEEVNERVQAQYALRLSEIRYRMLYDDTPSMYFTVDAEGRILSVNRFGADHLGYGQDELVGRSVLDLCPAPERSEFSTQLRECLKAGGDVRTWEVSHCRKDGAVIAVREIARMVRQTDGREMLLLVCEDITERNRLEQQFRQAQKMEAIGKLTGGIAHDFNNLLTVIRGYSDMTREEVDPKASVRTSLDAIGQAVDRAMTLTQQLLTFSRQQVVRAKVLDLNRVVEHVEDMLRRVIGAHIEFAVHPADGPAWIKADAGQLEQVLMNLVVNARDAMPTGGRLDITILRVTVTSADRQAGNPLPVGPAVALAVRDTGCGMDAATQARIFEPFYTTKPVGKGTGLGLSTVYGIVRQSGGHVAVTSQPGEGAIFTIYLPTAAPGESAESESPATPELPHGRETILVVEDDAMVRRLAVEVLRSRAIRSWRRRQGRRPWHCSSMRSSRSVWW